MTTTSRPAARAAATCSTAVIPQSTVTSRPTPRAGQPLDRRGRQAVALVEAAGQLPDRIAAERAQGANEDGGGADAVHVVVAEHRDPRAARAGGRGSARTRPARPGSVSGSWRSSAARKRRASSTSAKPRRARIAPTGRDTPSPAASRSAAPRHRARTPTWSASDCIRPILRGERTERERPPLTHRPRATSLLRRRRGEALQRVGQAPAGSKRRGTPARRRRGAPRRGAPPPRASRRPARRSEPPPRSPCRDPAAGVAASLREPASARTRPRRRPSSAVAGLPARLVNADAAPLLVREPPARSRAARPRSPVRFGRPRPEAAPRRSRASRLLSRSRAPAPRSPRAGTRRPRAPCLALRGVPTVTLDVTGSISASRRG